MADYVLPVIPGEGGDVCGEDWSFGDVSTTPRNLEPCLSLPGGGTTGFNGKCRHQRHARKDPSIRSFAGAPQFGAMYLRLPGRPKSNEKTGKAQRDGGSGFRA